MILTFMPAMAFATDGTSWPEPVDGVITFIGNVTLDNGSVINITDNTVMDLNGYQLVLSKANGITVKEGKTLTIKNGEIKANAFTKGTTSLFDIEKDASIELDAVNLETTGTALYPHGNAATVTVNNSKIKAGVYAVGTNAGKTDNYGVVINLNDSTFKTTGYQNNDGDDATIMINVAGTLNVNNCKVYGDRQCVLVRAGTAVVEKTDIYYSGKNGDSMWQQRTAEWGSGNEVATAAVVVGNKGKGTEGNITAYKADASLSLKDSNVHADADEYDNDEFGLPAVFVFDNNTYKSALAISGESYVFGGEVLVGTSFNEDSSIVLSGEALEYINVFDSDEDSEVRYVKVMNADKSVSVIKLSSELEDNTFIAKDNSGVYYKTIDDVVNNIRKDADWFEIYKNGVVINTDKDFDLEIWNESGSEDNENDFITVNGVKVLPYKSVNLKMLSLEKKLAEAQAALANAQSGKTTSDADLKKAQDDLKEAQKKLADAEAAKKAAEDKLAAIDAAEKAAAEEAAKYTPGVVTIKSAKGAKASAKVTFKKLDTEVTGYQIKFTNKSTKESKSVKIKSSKATIKKTVKKLAKKTKYSVKVRAFNTVNGKTYYGAWSKAKKFKTK